MAELAHMFEMGGPFMYLLVLVAPAAAAMGLLRLLTAAKGPMPGLMEGTLVGVLGFGLLGTAQGYIHTFKAVAAAAPDMKSELVERGMEMSAYPGRFSLAIAALALVLFLAAIWVQTSAGVKRAPLGYRIAGYVAVLVLVGGAFMFLDTMNAMNGLVGEFDGTTNTITSAESQEAMAQRISRGLYISMGVGMVSPILTLAGALSGVLAFSSHTRKEREARRAMEAAG